MKRLFVAVWIVAACLAVGLGTAAAQSSGASKAAGKKREDPEPVPGYKYREINGFRLLIRKTVMEEQENSTDRRKPLDVLELELSMIVRDLPPRAVTVLRTIPIWVEWDVPEEKPEKPDKEGGEKHGVTVAVYHPGDKMMKRYRYDSLERAVKANTVEIVRMKLLTREHQGERHRCVLLHEVAHAVHHHLFDYDNPHIKAAYEQAKAKSLYEEQYAMKNEKEYFAELSCAYFNHLHYEPRTREELKKYDPIGYRMMELTWGTPEEIEKAQKPEIEKNAMLKYTAAKRLSLDKHKKQEAIDALEALVQEFPDTRAAAEAGKLLKKLKP